MLMLSVGIFFLIENTGITWHSHDAVLQSEQGHETNTEHTNSEQPIKTIDPEDVPWHHD